MEGYQYEEHIWLKDHQSVTETASQYEPDADDPTTVRCRRLLPEAAAFPELSNHLTVLGLQHLYAASVDEEDLQHVQRQRWQVLCPCRELVKAHFTSRPGRNVQSNTISTSVGNFQPHIDYIEISPYIVVHECLHLCTLFCIIDRSRTRLSHN